MDQRVKKEKTKEVRKKEERKGEKERKATPPLPSTVL